MKVLIAGAGAVGGYFGSRILAGGGDVHFLGRGENAAAISSNGLQVKSLIHGDYVVTPVVHRSFADIPPSISFDVVFISVKGTGYEEFCRQIASEAGRIFHAHTVFIPLLNGVESEEILAKFIPADQVLGGLAHVGAEREAPGVLKHTTRGDMIISPFMPNNQAAAKDIVERLRAYNVSVDYHPDYKFVSWRKLVWNNGFNALTAITDLTMGECADDPDLSAIARSCMEETVAVALAEGVILPSDIVETMLKAGSVYGNARTSMNQDMRHNRPTEHEMIIGVVRRLGDRHRISTPVNDIMQSLIMGLERNRHAGTKNG